VKKLSKAILFALGGLVALALLLTLGINLYVQSPGTQARIQKGLSEALQLPLTITNTTLTPWSGLRINGITVPTDRGNFLEARTFGARYRLLPLFRRQLVIYDMRIEGPRIVWMQSEAGEWVLPQLADAPVRAARKKGEPRKKKERKKAEGEFEVVLDGFRIKDGSMEFFDKDQRRLALLTGVDMEYTTMDEDLVEGTATVARLTYAELFTFENVRARFRHADETFDLPELTADIAGGTLRGNYRLDSSGEESPFTAALQVERVDLARLTVDGGAKPGQAAGQLAGSVELRGDSRDTDKIEGKGQLTLSHGHFRQLELLQTVGQVLQFEELANLQLRSGRAEFHVAEGKTFVDSFLVESPDVKLSLAGTIRFDGKLSLDARLAVDDRNLARRPEFIRDIFAVADTPGERSLDFRISGNLNKPKTDLAEKLIGKTIGDQFENLLSGLLGTKKKKDDKKEEKKKKKKDDGRGDGLSVPPQPAAGQLPTSSPGGRPAPGRTAPTIPAPAPAGAAAPAPAPTTGP